jgi:hypothetical protein
MSLLKGSGTAGAAPLVESFSRNGVGLFVLAGFTRLVLVIGEEFGKRFACGVGFA